jgi:hypothetical protein
MRAMLSAKALEIEFHQKDYGTTKRESELECQKTYINQHAAFLIACKMGACYHFLC